MSIDAIGGDREDIDIWCELKEFGVPEFADFGSTNGAKIEWIEQEDYNATVRELAQ